jgi:hypothetical protein
MLQEQDSNIEQWILEPAIVVAASSIEPWWRSGTCG